MSRRANFRQYDDYSDGIEDVEEDGPMGLSMGGNLHVQPHGQHSLRATEAPSPGSIGM